MTHTRDSILPSDRNLKGQVATEFMLYTAVFMFVAIAAFLVVGQMQSSEIPFQQNNVAKEVGESFASVFLLSVKGGEGFSYNYTFPRTVFDLPYKVYMAPGGADVLIMEWEGSYGNFSASYDVPAYEYRFQGCLGGGSSDGLLVSNDCSNMLMFHNDGENLTIKQVGP